MKIRYVGHANTTIEVPALGLVVEPGETIEVPDQAGKQLVAQDAWRKVSSKRTKAET